MGQVDNCKTIDFGMKEWNEFEPNEIIRKYRQFVYETGAAESQGTGVRNQGTGFRKKGYRISRAERFRYRCRYFTDSGVIGGKDFVQEAPVKWEDPNEMRRNFMGQEFYGVNI